MCQSKRLKLLSCHALSYFGTTGHFLCKSNDGAYVTEHSGKIDGTPYKVKFCYSNECNQPSALALTATAATVNGQILAIAMLFFSAIFTIYLI